MNGNLTDYSYDGLGRLTDVTSYNGDETSDPKVMDTDYEYDSHGNLSIVKTYPDLTTPATIVQTDYKYDDFGRLVEVDSPDTNVTRYVYDESGRLVHKIRNATGETEDTRHSCYHYDDLGRLSITDNVDPSNWGQGDYSSGCSTVANVIPDVGDVWYYYDEDSVDMFAEHSDIIYPWVSTSDGKGKLTAAATHLLDYGEGSIAYSVAFYKYDARGLVIETKEISFIEDDDPDPTTTDDLITRYKYDDNNNLTQIVYPSGNCVQYDYHSPQSTAAHANQVKTIRYRLLGDDEGGGEEDDDYCDVDQGTWTTLVDEVAYDPFGDVKSMKYKHGSDLETPSGDDIDTITYTRNKRYITTAINIDPDYSAADIFDAAYTIGDDGNITDFSIDISPASVSSVTSYHESFTYNDVGMLIEAEDGGYGDYYYSYDDIGNREDIQVAPLSTYDYTYSSETNKLADIKINSETPQYTFHHNNFGDISMIEDEIADNSTLFSYDLTGRLSSVDVTAEEITINTIKNYYNHLSQRVIAEQDGDPLRFYTYDLAGRMLSEIHAIDNEEDINPVLDFVYLGNRRVAVISGVADAPCFIATAVMGTSMSADLGALRAFRDKVIKKFSLGRSFVKWYYREGPKGAAWLNAHPRWKPVVRVALIIPVSVSKITATGRPINKIGVLLLMVGCFGFAVGAGRYESWRRRKTFFVGFLLAFVTVITYSMFMVTSVSASQWPASEAYTELGAYFFYEDHIGRPISVSEVLEDDDDDSYFVAWSQSDVIWQATYKPFGEIDDDFDSTGIRISEPEESALWWSIPFRFPGQYSDPEANDSFYYNHHRFYMPSIGRYNRADPLLGMSLGRTNGNLTPPANILLFSGEFKNIQAFTFLSEIYSPNYTYAWNSPLMYQDNSGLLNNCVTGCATIAAIVAGMLGIVAEGIIPKSTGSASGAFIVTVVTGMAGGVYACDSMCNSLCSKDKCNILCFEEWGIPKECECEYRIKFPVFDPSMIPDYYYEPEQL